MALLASATLLAVISGTLLADDEPRKFSMPPHVAAQPGPEQPIAFSHKQHAGDLRLPCMNCHVVSGNSAASATTDDSPRMDIGLPPTSTCMICHQAVETDRPGIQILSQYHADVEIVPWVRVYELLPGVNWSHQPHTDAGLACETCHGEVTGLEVMSVQTPVTAMGTCLGCHQASGANSECTTCHAWPTDATFETRLTDR